MCASRAHCWSPPPPLPFACARSVETLQTFLDLVSYRVSLSDLFDIQTVGHGGASPSAQPPGAHSHGHSHSHSHAPPSALPADTVGPSYVFRGFVGYYGLHYISVFQDRASSGPPYQTARRTPSTQAPHAIFFPSSLLSFSPRRTRHVPSSALPCPALPCPALPCLALPCLALPCLALPCPALPCPALPCRASAIFVVRRLERALPGRVGTGTPPPRSTRLHPCTREIKYMSPELTATRCASRRGRWAGR